MNRAKVRLCIGCKAEIDRGRSYKLLQETLPARGWYVVPSWQEDAPQVFILINGCPVGCLEKPSDAETVVVKGHTVEGIVVEDENELVEKVGALLEQRFNTSKA